MPVITSDSLVRVQVYGALAYGARGLYYYCWGHGIWNMPHPLQVEGRGTPTVNYNVVKATNADAAVWGAALLRARHVGALSSSADIDAARANDAASSGSGSSPPPPSSRHSSRAKATPVGPGKAVTTLAPDMLVGVFSDGALFKAVCTAWAVRSVSRGCSAFRHLLVCFCFPSHH